MKTNLFKLACAVLIFSLGTALAVAHTTATTSPKTGSVLTASPASIEITFKEAARLTSVIVHQQGKAERKLSFTPSGSATIFSVADPMLEVGKSEVRWIALSPDGHVIKGVIALTLNPSTAKTN